MLKRTMLLLGLLLIGSAIPVQAQFTAGPKPSSVVWSVAVAASFHRHDYQNPLPWWENSGRIFPSIMLNGELPMTFIEGPLGRKLSLRSGLRYTRLASRVDWEFDVESSEEAFTGKFSINQHYLTIPLQLKLIVGNAPVYLVAGADFGFLLFARKKSETLTPVEFKSSQTEAVGSDIRPLNISLAGGLGIALSSLLRSYVRYASGLSNAKKDAERTVLDSDWSTREVEIGIEFLFPGRKDP